MRSARWRPLALVAAMLWSAAAGVAQEPPPAVAPAAPPPAPVAAPATPPAAPAPGTLRITGSWSGARLRCQKDEGKILRCGTPAPFTVVFDEAGTGTTPDDSLPHSFTWRWLSANEIVIVPAGGGDEIKLFSVERDSDALTFQAYIYLPTSGASAATEERYVHYIFDVTLDE